MLWFATLCYSDSWVVLFSKSILITRGKEYVLSVLHPIWNISRAYSRSLCEYHLANPMSQSRYPCIYLAYLYRSQQSSSGVAGNRSTLSFSGSAPGADTSLNKSGGPLIDMNKSGNTNPASESGIARSSRPSSSGASSSTLTHKEDAGTRAAVYSPDEG